MTISVGVTDDITSKPNRPSDETVVLIVPNRKRCSGCGSRGLNESHLLLPFFLLFNPDVPIRVSANGIHAIVQ